MGWFNFNLGIFGLEAPGYTIAGYSSQGHDSACLVAQLGGFDDLYTELCMFPSHNQRPLPRNRLGDVAIVAQVRASFRTDPVHCV